MTDSLKNVEVLNLVNKTLKLFTEIRKELEDGLDAFKAKNVC